jgi:hypothetical protein
MPRSAGLGDALADDLEREVLGGDGATPAETAAEDDARGACWDVEHQRMTGEWLCPAYAVRVGAREEGAGRIVHAQP